MIYFGQVSGITSVYTVGISSFEIGLVSGISSVYSAIFTLTSHHFVFGKVCNIPSVDTVASSMASSVAFFIGSPGVRLKHRKA